jgi:hypothetical protein
VLEWKRGLAAERDVPGEGRIAALLVVVSEHRCAEEERLRGCGGLPGAVVRGGDALATARDGDGHEGKRLVLQIDTRSGARRWRRLRSAIPRV